MDNGEKGMNLVAMTIIKEYLPSWGSNQRPPILKSATLTTELWGSALMDKIFYWSKLKALADVLFVGHVNYELETSIFAFSHNIFRSGILKGG